MTVSSSFGSWVRWRRKALALTQPFKIHAINSDRPREMLWVMDDS
jgi:hypothetical protein